MARSRTGFRTPGPRLATLALLAAWLPLAGCSSDSETVEVAVDRCPTVAALPDADRLVRFAPGPGRDLTDVVLTARVADYVGGCEYGDGEVEMTMRLTIVGERGPAGTTGRIPLQYFIAITDGEQRVLSRKLFDTDLDFSDGRMRAGTQEDLTQLIALPGGAPDGPSYSVMIGLQLTPEEIAYNRR